MAKLATLLLGVGHLTLADGGEFRSQDSQKNDLQVDLYLVRRDCGHVRVDCFQTGVNPYVPTVSSFFTVNVVDLGKLLILLGGTRLAYTKQDKITRDQIMIKLSLAALVSAAILVATPAQATLLTFEGTLPETATINISGYRFTMASHYFHFGNWAATNGTRSVLVHRNGGAEVPVTLTTVDGSYFALDSIDLGEGTLTNNARTITATGTLATGGSVTKAFAIDGFANGSAAPNDYQTFTFGAGWNNLSKVVFTTTTNNDSNWSFDNVNIGAARADVPEPSSLALLGIGALALMRRRLRK